jgi:hypothetical protein
MAFDPKIDEAGCEEICGFYKAIYDWCLRQMALQQKNGNLEDAARWGMAAAGHASGPGYFGVLADSALEEMLLSIGRSIPVSPRKGGSRSKTTYVHVLSEAYTVGGHTRLCRRWIEMDSTTNRHNVVLTSQLHSPPDDLRQTVECFGGEFTVLDRQQSLLERARHLREIVCADVDAVILHTHMDDPLPVMAFAVGGIPPVLFLNHADHTYWLGASVADLVADIRASGQTLTRNCRGIDNSIILPIPLRERDYDLDDHKYSPEQKKSAKIELGIPENAVIFLTIGTEGKYRALNDYDFVNVAQRILDGCQTAYLIAIGPRDEGRWAAASKKCGGRLMALGVKEDLSVFRAIADIYLEGFPFGSLTALLESGLAGLPCVGTPGATPLPFKSDDIALDGMLTPASVEDYIAEALRLGRDSNARSLMGQTLQTTIVEHHCGKGWLEHLAKVYDLIPENHAAVWAGVPRLVSKTIRDYWVSFQRQPTSANFADLVTLVYRKPEWQGMPLAGGTDRRLHSDLVNFAKRMNKRTGEDCTWLCEIYSTDGHRAYIEKDLKRLFWNLFRSLSVAPTDARNRVLASLMVESLVGAEFMERLRSFKRSIRSNCNRISHRLNF